MAESDRLAIRSEWGGFVWSIIEIGIKCLGDAVSNHEIFQFVIHAHCPIMHIKLYILILGGRRYHTITHHPGLVIKTKELYPCSFIKFLNGEWCII